MDEVTTDYFTLVFEQSLRDIADTAKMLGMCKKSVIEWAKRLGLYCKKPKLTDPVYMRNLTPRQRDYYENLDHWGGKSGRYSK